MSKRHVEGTTFTKHEESMKKEQDSTKKKKKKKKEEAASMAMEVKRIADDAWLRGHISVGRYVCSPKIILFLLNIASNLCCVVSVSSAVGLRIL